MYVLFLAGLFFILGSAVGSFLNVVIDRTSRGESLMGRSHCDHCRATLSTVDLVPIFSFVGLGAKCRRCRGKLSWQYPLVEGATGLVFLATLLNQVTNSGIDLVALIIQLTVFSIFIVVFAIDLKYSLIPTTLVFAASFLVLFYNYFTLSSADFVASSLTALFIAFAFLVLVLVTRGRGMGVGDIPLAALIGLFLKYPASVVAIFLAFVIGGFASLILILIGRKNFGQTIPFGPFLVLGAVISFFYWQQIIDWYLGLL